MPNHIKRACPGPHLTLTLTLTPEHTRHETPWCSLNLKIGLGLRLGSGSRLCALGKDPKRMIFNWKFPEGLTEPTFVLTPTMALNSFHTELQIIRFYRRRMPNLNLTNLVAYWNIKVASSIVNALASFTYLLSSDWNADTCSLVEDPAALWFR